MSFTSFFLLKSKFLNHLQLCKTRVAGRVDPAADAEELYWLCVLSMKL